MTNAVRTLNYKVKSQNKLQLQLHKDYLNKINVIKKYKPL